MSSHPDIDSFAEGPLDNDDLMVLQLVKDMLESVDPVPAELTDRAQFAMTVALLHAEVASIVEPELTADAVRATDYDRATSITFVSGGLTVMVTVEQTGAETAMLRGWLTTPGAEVELRERSRTREIIADDEGRFLVEGVSRGLVHLVIRPGGDAKPVITPTFEV